MKIFLLAAWALAPAARAQETGAIGGELHRQFEECKTRAIRADLKSYEQRHAGRVASVVRGFRADHPLDSSGLSVVG